MLRMRRTLFASVIALGLLAPVTSVAHADDPVPTITTVKVEEGDHIGESTYVVVRVKDVNGNWAGGSVTLSGPGQADVTKEVSPVNGYAQFFWPTVSNEPATFTAVFTGSNGFGNSTGSGTSQPLRSTFFHPEPTIAKLGAGAKLTLTLSARATDFTGAPKVGIPLLFMLNYHPGTGGPLVGTPPTYIKVCDAVTDATGFASCKGAGTVASILSILAGAYVGVGPTYTGGGKAVVTKLPTTVQ